jgi:hypothetical protein
MGEQGGTMLRSLYFISLLLSQGCTSYYLKGARMWENGLPSQYEAAYQASTCTEVDKPDKPIVFNIRYYLVNTPDGLGLVEVDEKGKNAAVFTNKWADETNDYFFGYVRGSAGYLFTVPKNRALAALRSYYHTINFVIGAARVDWDAVTGPDGVTRPTGKAAATCPLAPQAMASASAPK